MDKLISFKAKNHASHMKSQLSQDYKLQFQSEEDGQSTNTPDATPENKTKKRNYIKMHSFQTEDSDNGTPKTGTVQSLQQYGATKLSRFSNLVNQKTIDGDVENEPELSDDENDQKPNQNTPQDNYEIEEQAQRIQQKLQSKHYNPFPKLAKANKTISMQNINANQKTKTNDQQQDKLSTHPFRHLIFRQNVSEQTFKKHLVLTQRGLIYARKCLKGPSENFIQSKKVILPETDPKKQRALILDLDETLVHACSERDNPQIYLPTVSENGEEGKVGINIRPYTALFLQRMSSYYTIYVYTASSQAYAQTIVNYLDPNKKYISGMMTRSNCMETKNGFFIKDLRLIQNKELKDMLFIDNLVHSFGFQIENGVPILEWFDDSNDCELKELMDYLIEATNYDDLREYNVKKLKLDELIDFHIE